MEKRKKLKADEFWRIMENVGVTKGNYKQLAMYVESMYWNWRREDKAAGRNSLADTWDYRANYIHEELEKNGFYK